MPAVALYSVAEALDDPQVKHLSLIESIAHPQAGELKFVGGPVQFDPVARALSAPPPLAGEQSDKILGELGYSGSAIDDLAARGVTRTRP